MFMSQEVILAEAWDPNSAHISTFCVFWVFEKKKKKKLSTAVRPPGFCVCTLCNLCKWMCMCTPHSCAWCMPRVSVEHKSHAACVLLLMVMKRKAGFPCYHCKCFPVKLKGAGLDQSVSGIQTVQKMGLEFTNFLWWFYFFIYFSPQLFLFSLKAASETGLFFTLNQEFGIFVAPNITRDYHTWSES